jgi:hypothetical protein
MCVCRTRVRAQCVSRPGPYASLGQSQSLDSVGTIWGPRAALDHERLADMRSSCTVVRARTPCLTCGNADPCELASSGRRFESCQPDGEVAGEEPVSTGGGVAFSLTVRDLVTSWLEQVESA